MSTLSLRKIKHDSSAVDNITLDSNGRVGVQQASPNVPFEVGGSWRLGTNTSGTYTGGLGGGFNPNNNIYSMYCRDRTDTNWNDLWIESKTMSLKVNGGDTAIYMDQSGRVRMSYQPFFTVRQPANQTSTGGTGYYFYNYSDIIQNVGSHFNNSTGRFTAPITGVYLFRGIVMGADPADSSPHCGFSINGNANTGGGSYASNAMWEHPSGAGHKTDTMHIIKLNANDNIRFIQLSSVFSNQAERIYFMGYLLG